MAESKYPLIEQLGLAVFENSWNQDIVMASCLEGILESAPVRFCSGSPTDRTANIVADPIHLSRHAKNLRFRIILVEPIKEPDTAESLLREYLNLDPGRIGPKHFWADRVKAWAERQK